MSHRVGRKNERDHALRHALWAGALLPVLAGCLSPLALDHAVMAYDQATTQIQSKQLLLNIARAYEHHPLHFTGISNIAATFNFQLNAGATPALTGETGGLLMPIFGGSVAENPTISIVPIEGEEFTRRLLTPFQETKLTMLLRQGADIDLILRLLAGELRIKHADREAVLHNRPNDPAGYREFRQYVTHLSSIQDRHAMFVEPLLFNETWELPAADFSPEQLSSLQQQFDVVFDISRQRIQLTKRVTGRIILTNYDPQRLPNDERIRLNAEAETGASNDVLVDIRPGYPGGELPLHGFFRLRSVYNVLNFIGRSIDDEPEFFVEKHPLTPPVSENPVQTLAITISENAPPDDTLAVWYQGHYFWVTPDETYPWNREAFRLLYQIFQMTVAELTQQGAPQITIAK